MNILHARATILTIISCLTVSVDLLQPAQDASEVRQRRVAASKTSSDSRPFTSGDFGLPLNNKINSPYDEWRVYANVDRGSRRTLLKVVPEYYVPNIYEIKKQHHAIDLTSHNPEGTPTSLEYKTPIDGKVSYFNDSYNTVKITSTTGGELRILHSSEVYQENVGKFVKAGTPIGKTGSKGVGAKAIHLHYETRSPEGILTEPGEWRAKLRLVRPEEFQVRETNVKKIEESLIAKGSLKPRPGGILFDKQAEMLSDLSDVDGAFYDPQSERIIFVGERIVDSPAMDKGLLAVALRAVYSDSAPGVSIDPSSDPSVMRVRYLGQTESTRFGAIMFEADRMLKALSRGEDNLTRQAVNSFVPGYQSIVNRSASNPNTTEGSSLYRLWFKPDKLVLKKTVDGRSVTFVESTMTCDWENMQGVDPGPAVQTYVNHLNNNFHGFAEEYPIFQDMLFLEKIVGLALWMRDQNLFLDPDKLGIESADTPRTTPATTVTSSIKIGNSVWKLLSTGGVDFSVANMYSPDTDRDAARLREAALRDRPRLDQVSWDFKLNGKYLTAVALPVTNKNFAPLRLTRKTYVSFDRVPLILNAYVREEGDNLIVAFGGNNFGHGMNLNQVLLNNRPVSVVTWSDSKVIVRVPAGTDGGRFVIVADGQHSNPITLSVVSRPVMATVRVVNEVNATLYLNVGEQRLVIPALRSEVLVLPTGRYAFTASAGTARDSGVKEFSPGENTWSFRGHITPQPEQTPEYTQARDDIAEIVIENTGNVALTVSIRGPKSLQLSIASGTHSMPIRVPAGLYTVQGQHGNFSTEAKIYTVSDDTRRITIQIGVVKTYKIRTVPRGRP